MKKTCLVLTMAFSTAMAFANPTVSVDSIPQGAKDFISANFGGFKATYAEGGSFDFSVVLDDGTEINFSKNGDWQSVESHGKVAPGILPPHIAKRVAENSEGGEIIKIEKKHGNYDVRLSNKIHLIISEDGNLIEKKRAGAKAPKKPEPPKKAKPAKPHEMPGKPGKKNMTPWGNPFAKRGMNNMRPDAKSGATPFRPRQPNPDFKPWSKPRMKPEGTNNAPVKPVPPANEEAPIPVPADPTLQAQ